MIDEFTIGSFTIAGRKYLGDLKLIDGKVRYWQDRHKQILRLKDIGQLLDAQPDTILIGTGCSGLLQIPDEVLRVIRMAHIHLIVQKTPDACKTYNKLLAEKHRVAAIFQAT